jgi:hypothetical protein
MATKDSPKKGQEVRKTNEEIIHLRDRERILLRKLDQRNAKLASIYQTPFRFAAARFYHRFIKRDEKNA